MVATGPGDDHLQELVFRGVEQKTHGHGGARAMQPLSLTCHAQPASSQQTETITEPSHQYTLRDVSGAQIMSELLRGGRIGDPHYNLG